MRRTRRIYKRQTRSNLETLIILIGAIIILSVAFYMAREKSFLPPKEFKVEEEAEVKEEVAKVSEDEQKAIGEIIIQSEKIAESVTMAPQKPVEEGNSAPVIVQTPSRESEIPAKPAVTVPAQPKPETPAPPAEIKPATGAAYTVQVGFFSIESNARNLAKEIENRGFQTFVIKQNNYFKVQVGEYPLREQAEKALQQLKNMGYETWLTQK